MQSRRGATGALLLPQEPQRPESFPEQDPDAFAKVRTLWKVSASRDPRRTAISYSIATTDFFLRDFSLAIRHRVGVIQMFATSNTFGESSRSAVTGNLLLEVLDETMEIDTMITCTRGILRQRGKIQIPQVSNQAAGRVTVSTDRRVAPRRK